VRTLYVHSIRPCIPGVVGAVQIFSQSPVNLASRRCLKQLKLIRKHVNLTYTTIYYAYIPFPEFKCPVSCRLINCDTRTVAFRSF